MRHVPAVFAALFGVAAMACGATPSDPSAERVGVASSAFSCSPAGDYMVDAVGTWQDVTGPSYACTGVKPLAQAVRVRVAPHSVANQWLVTVNSQKLAGPVKETDGFINVTFGGLEGANICGSANTGKVTVKIDDAKVYVSIRCTWSSSPSCARYSDVAGTLPRACAAPDGGPSEAGAPDSGPSDAGAPDGEPSEAGPDAEPTDAGASDGSAPDGAVTEPPADGPDATGTDPETSTTPPSGDPSTTAPEPTAPPTTDLPAGSAAHAPTCTASRGRASASPVASGLLAAALGLLLARRRKS